MVTAVRLIGCYGVLMTSPLSRLRSAWKALRGHFWGSLAIDVVLIMLVFILIHAWQTRDLPKDDHTPALELAWLDGMRADTILVTGETGVVYFFAPWCFYCKKSIDNLDELVAAGDLSWARVVALDYGSLDEVREFISETRVSLPVLLGTAQTMQDWQIRAFPTYFVIDGDGQIASRSVGYSTKLGLKARVWFNED